MLLLVSDTAYNLIDECKEDLLKLLNRVLNSTKINKVKLQIPGENAIYKTNVLKKILQENWEGNEETEQVIFTTTTGDH